MRKSEIFESFVKIAQERGLVSESEHAEHTEKDFSETNPRHDSLSIEQISKLYNTKQKRPEDMDYKKNIMEDAHPDRLVISPSYDKLNGLVENEIDGQNIRIHITRKDPDGHLTQRKYAEKNLILSLVRVANELDNQDNDELRKLADACLLQASQGGLKKKAVPVVPIVIGVIALVGAVYAYEHITTQEGLREDYKKLTDKIAELQKSTISFGTGYKFSDEFNKFLADLAAKEKMINDAVAAFQNAMAKSSAPKTKEELSKTDAKDVMATAQNPEGQEIAATYENLKKVVDNLDPYFIKVHQNLNDAGFRERAIVDKGIITEWIDKIPGLRNQQKNEYLMGTFFKDLNDLVSNYESDVKKIKEGTDAGKAGEKEAKTELTKPQTSSPEKPKEAPKEENKGGLGSDLEDEAKGLFGGLLS